MLLHGNVYVGQKIVDDSMNSMKSSAMLLQITIDVMHLGRLYVGSETLSVLIATQCLLLWLRFQFFIRSVMFLYRLTCLMVPLPPSWHRLIAVNRRTTCLLTLHAPLSTDSSTTRIKSTKCLTSGISNTRSLLASS